MGTSLALQYCTSHTDACFTTVWNIVLIVTSNNTTLPLHHPLLIKLDQQPAVTTSNQPTNQPTRRCTSEIAFGSCEGVGSSDQIVRCDTCGAWSHVYCGGVSIGGTVEPVIGWSHSTHPNALASEVSQCSQPEAAVGAVGAAAAAATTAATAISPAVPVVKEEHICRTCARAAAGSNGGDGPPWTVSTLVGGRVNRKRVLRFLEREATEGWPIGVFDFNVSLFLFLLFSFLFPFVFSFWYLILYPCCAAYLCIAYVGVTFCFMFFVFMFFFMWLCFVFWMLGL